MTDKIYFSHFCNTHQQTWFRLLQRRFGWEWVGRYWALMEKLYVEGNSLNTQDRDAIDLLILDFGCDEKELIKILDFLVDRGEFTNQEGVYSSNVLAQNLEMRERRSKTALKAHRSRKRNKLVGADSPEETSGDPEKPQSTVQNTIHNDEQSTVQNTMHNDEQSTVQNTMHNDMQSTVQNTMHKGSTDMIKNMKEHDMKEHDRLVGKTPTNHAESTEESPTEPTESSSNNIHHLPPENEQQVITYFEARGAPPESAQRFFRHYSESEWRDTGGKTFAWRRRAELWIRDDYPRRPRGRPEEQTAMDEFFKNKKQEVSNGS